MRRILLAFSLVVFAFSTQARAFETPLAGDWQLAGADAKGKYTGTATVALQDDGHYSISFTLAYGNKTSGKAFFVGDASGVQLTGQRGDPNGIVGALSNAPKNAVAARYRLSDDGKSLVGDFGAFHETLTRTLGATVKIVILHTNDVHGQVLPLKTQNGSRGGYAALVARLRKERAAALASGASVLTLDAGDIYAGTPEGDETHGVVDLDAMGLAGYDAMALGNHEFDQTVSTVKDLVESAPFPVLSANLIDTTTQKRPGWKNLSGSIRLNVAGVKVCIVGLLTSTLKQVTTAEGSAGVDATLEEPAARKELAANADSQVNIFVTHVGSEGDEQLAQALKEKIAVIVGGHTHEAITSPQRWPQDSGALVVQAGKSGQWLGRVDLEVDRATGKVVSVSGKLIPVSPSEGEAADVAAIIKKDSGDVTAQYDSVLGTLSKALPRKGSGSTPFGDFLTDAMAKHAHVPIAIYNKTGVRGDLLKGPVHLRDLYQCAPFADHNVVLTLKGSDLLAVLEGSLDPQIGSPPALEVSGLTVKYDQSQPGGHRVKSVSVGNAPLDPAKSYRVVTGKFLSEGGDGHVAFKKATDLADEGGSLLDALRGMFHGNAVNPATPARWVGN